jgi:hypothetical protein
MKAMSDPKYMLWIVSRFAVPLVAALYLVMAWRTRVSVSGNEKHTGEWLARIHFALFLIAGPVIGGVVGMGLFGLMVSCQELGCLAVIGWVVAGVLVGLAATIVATVLAWRKLLHGQILRFAIPLLGMAFAILYAINH